MQRLSRPFLSQAEDQRWRLTRHCHRQSNGVTPSSIAKATRIPEGGRPIAATEISRAKPPATTTSASSLNLSPLASIRQIVLQNPMPIPSKSPERYRKWLSAPTPTTASTNFGPSRVPVIPAATGTNPATATQSCNSDRSCIKLGRSVQLRSTRRRAIACLFAEKSFDGKSEGAAPLIGFRS